MPDQPALIGDYRILDLLGRGGMGVVYVAEHVASGEAAAVKTVRVPTESSLESLRREIHALSSLHHPGVVRIRDHGIADGMPWYAMDLLRGRTLRDYFRAWWGEPTEPRSDTRNIRGPAHDLDAEPAAAQLRLGGVPPFTIAGCLGLFRRICAPLAFLHGEGLVHRDLSPTNIFILDGERPTLFDFGLAAHFRTDSARDVLEVGGQAVGTTHYMAPEQVRGEVVDARADVYALGCILYEAVTGRPPFLGETRAAVLWQHVEDLPPAASALNPALPAELDDLLARMLAKRPRDRIGYVADVARALDRLGATPDPDGDDGRPPPRSYTYRSGVCGRGAWLDRFDAVIAQLEARQGGCAVISGEGGVGKTRLVAEIATRAASRGLRVITGECQPVAITTAGDADADVHAAPLQISSIT
ncbi:MAG: serine/threonine-protein kinase PknK, partial [Myxococcales bacterium]|nr:serine/threonine-protein kinase PknK [Myxococcales bacterium]